MEIELNKLSSPRIFLVRMLVFLVLCALVMVVLYNSSGRVLRQSRPQRADRRGAVDRHHSVVPSGIRLYRKSHGSTTPHLRPGLAVDRHPKLLAPMAAILGASAQAADDLAADQRHLLDSIATRSTKPATFPLYDRLLVFLGLLGTFWGLIETVGSVGKVIDGLKVGGDAGALFDT